MLELATEAAGCRLKSESMSAPRATEQDFLWSCSRSNRAAKFILLNARPATARARSRTPTEPALLHLFAQLFDDLA